MSTYGFIGCGNMGGTLAACCAEIHNENTFLCDRNTSKTTAIAEKTGAKIATMTEIAENCRYIFLGVKPQVLPAVLKELKTLLQNRDDVVLVSMAAGVSIATIEAEMGDLPIIRIMPNTPAAVGEGLILYCRNEKVTDLAIEGFLASLSSAGTLYALAENSIDAASALSGCGPAFVYMFIEAMADGAVKCGLPRDEALLFAAQTVIGAGKMVKESNLHPAALKDAVCSPGGSTIAGVAALENGAFRSAVLSAVEAAYQRTTELGKH